MCKPNLLVLLEEADELGMNHIRRFPLRQMGGPFHSDEAAPWQSLHHKFALFKRDCPILFSPDHQNRPAMLTDTFKLFHLIRVGIAGDFQKAGPPETFEAHLLAIPLRPIRKMLRMKKIPELVVGPKAFIEDDRQVVPNPGHPLSHGQWIWMAD